MAGGNISPRQKMINMMYLVLTAMLALNVSKDILKALSKLDDSMHATVQTVEAGNTTLYATLTAAAQEKERAKEWNQRAQALRPQAQDAYTFIEDIKSHLIEETGGRDAEGGLKGSDNRDVPTNYLLNDKSVGGGGMAKELRSKLEAYKAFLIENAGDNQQLVASINSTFDFSPVQEAGEDAPRSWEEATFAELPLAGVIPFLTDLQASVRRAENNMLEEFVGNVDATQLKTFNKVRPVIQANNYVTQGDNFEAEIFLAAYDDSQNPDFIIGGQPFDAENVTEGIAHYSEKATGVGERTINGMIKLPGTDVEVPFEYTYTVAPPSAVISPTKMNVLYRQVDNPLEISVPGVAPDKLVVSGSGISGSNGTYMANVTNVSGTSMNISVGVREEDGSVRSVGSKEFRIKGLPPASAMIFQRTNSGPYSSGAIANAPVEAAYQDFPFDLPLTVRSFQLVVPGEAPFNITGNRLTSAAKAAVQAARPGATIIIRDVIATTPKGERIRNISSLTLDLN